jgi:hypothetical protein
MKTWELLSDYRDLKEGYKVNESSCVKCDLLSEAYNRTPKSYRDYWIMTELFVLLHGSDECKGDKNERY